MNTRALRRAASGPAALAPAAAARDGALMRFGQRDAAVPPHFRAAPYHLLDRIEAERLARLKAS